MVVGLSALRVLVRPRHVERLVDHVLLGRVQGFSAWLRQVTHQLRTMRGHVRSRLVDHVLRAGNTVQGFQHFCTNTGKDLKWFKRRPYLNWLKPRPESGRDWLTSSKFEKAKPRRVEHRVDHALRRGKTVHGFQLVHTICISIFIYQYINGSSQGQNPAVTG